MDLIILIGAPVALAVWAVFATIAFLKQKRLAKDSDHYRRRLIEASGKLSHIFMYAPGGIQGALIGISKTSEAINIADLQGAKQWAEYSDAMIRKIEDAVRSQR